MKGFASIVAVGSAMVGFGMLSVVGCAAPTEAPGEGAAEEVEASSSAVTVQNRCRPASASDRAARQLKATQAVSYVFGDDSVAFPATAACEDFKVGLDALRAGIAADPESVTKTSQNQVCGMPANVYRFATNPATFRSVLKPAFKKVDKCLGKGVEDFFVTAFDSDGEFVEIDPGPVMLSAHMSTVTGSTVTGLYIPTMAPTYVVKFGSSYAPCGTSAAHVGKACSPDQLLAGSITSSTLIKTGSLCACR